MCRIVGNLLFCTLLPASVNFATSDISIHLVELSHTLYASRISSQDTGLCCPFPPIKVVCVKGSLSSISGLNVAEDFPTDAYTSSIPRSLDP